MRFLPGLTLVLGLTGSATGACRDCIYALLLRWFSQPPLSDVDTVCQQYLHLPAIRRRTSRLAI